MSERIAMHAIAVEPEVHADVDQILRSGRLTAGPFCARLEDASRLHLGADSALAVANGTVALELAFEALADDRPALAVVPSLTFGATLNAALRSGCRVVVCDVGDDHTMAPDAAADAVRAGLERWADTAVVILCPVHLYGLPAAVDAIVTAVGDPGVPVEVLGDGAQAHGASWGDRPVAAITPHATFSFYPTKNVSGAEGGLVTTADPAIAEIVGQLRNQGTSGRYQYARIGTNARLSELQAAVAWRAMEVLPADTAARTAHAERLTALLGDLDGIAPPDQRLADGRTGCWHQYVVRVDPALRGGRDALAAHLDAAGIDSDVVYPDALSAYAPFATHARVLMADDTTARRTANEVLSLPVHRRLGDEQVDAIGAAVAAWAGA